MTKLNYKREFNSLTIDELKADSELFLGFICKALKKSGMMIDGWITTINTTNHKELF